MPSPFSQWRNCAHRFRLFAVSSARSLIRNRVNRPQAAHLTRVDSRCTGRTIVRTGWLITALMVGLQTAAQLTNAFVLAHPRPGLDAAVDGSIFDWGSFGAAFIAAVILVGLAVTTAQGRSAAVLGVLVAFLALDDLTNLHDHLGTAFARGLPEPFNRLSEWSTPLLYLPLLAVTFGLLWLHGGRVAPAPARQIRAALALLAGAVALRLFAGILEIRDLHAPAGIQAIGVAVLEGTELGAWTLVAAAFVAEGVDVVRRASAP